MSCKALFGFFFFIIFFSLSFVFTLFCGSFEVSVTQVWEMCWSCLLYKGEHRGETEMSSFRQKLTTSALAMCKHIIPHTSLPTHRGKNNG